MRALAVILWLSLTCGCVLDVSYDGTQFRCAPDIGCPQGQTCVGGFCQGASVDASSSVDAAGDASAADAGQLTATSRVAASGDDVEERVDTGSVDVLSSDLELVNASFNSGTETADQVTGLRFPGLMVPGGATITGATLQFTVDEVGSGVTVLVLRGEAADDAASFANVAGEITARTRTTAFAAWDVPAWATAGDAGDAQKSPDLSAVIQEIVDRPGWSAGSALAIIVTGSGKRVAVAFDSATGAVAGAELTVTYR